MGKFVALADRRVQIPVRVTLETQATLDAVGAENYGHAVDEVASEWRAKQNGSVAEKITARHEVLVTDAVLKYQQKIEERKNKAVKSG